MNMTSTLAEIAKWDVDDRLQLVEAVWSTIAAEPNLPEVTEAQKKDLEERLARMDAAPENLLTLEELEARLRDGL